MKLAYGADDLAFRDDVRAFLDRALTPELREAARSEAGVFAAGDIARRWHRILFEQGWVAPSWPKEYGGPGWRPAQRYVFAEECAAAGAPVLPAMGLQMCGPILIGCGSAEQKQRFLPHILSGEHFWCQGFSEPQAGSDLAALKCRAERDGDHYVITGDKIWTTHAQFANWIFVLARSDPQARPQHGITFLLVDMKTPGLSVTPIISLSGEHEVNQVFFDGVRVPIANRVGEEHRGWQVAKYLLEFERGGVYAPRAKALLGLARQVAHACGDEDSLTFWARYARLEVDVLAQEMSEKRIVSTSLLGEGVNAQAASRLKLRGSELIQRATELALDAAGVYASPRRTGPSGGNETLEVGPPDARAVSARYVNARAMSIFGGSNEIQRNILARTLQLSGGA